MGRGAGGGAGAQQAAGSPEIYGGAPSAVTRACHTDGGAAGRTAGRELGHADDRVRPRNMKINERAPTNNLPRDRYCRQSAPGTLPPPPPLPARTLPVTAPVHPLRPPHAFPGLWSDSGGGGGGRGGIGDEGKEEE